MGPFLTTIHVLGRIDLIIAEVIQVSDLRKLFVYSYFISYFPSRKGTARFLKKIVSADCGLFLAQTRHASGKNLVRISYVIFYK